MGVRYPRGLGLYLLRESLYPGGSPIHALRGGYSWVAANPGTPDAVIVAHKSRGLPVWLYATPESWRPGNWARTLDRLAGKAARMGLTGVIADPEEAPLWRPHRAQATKLANALERLPSYGLGAGLTSFPTHPMREEWARPRVWGSPQIYWRPGRQGIAYKRFVGMWRSTDWFMVVPSIGAFARPGTHPGPTVAQLRAYLDNLPVAQAAIVWGAPPLHVSTWLAYNPNKLPIAAMGGAAVGALMA